MLHLLPQIERNAGRSIVEQADFIKKIGALTIWIDKSVGVSHGLVLECRPTQNIASRNVDCGDLGQVCKQN